MVWVGLDTGRVGLTGGTGAAPLWQDFMQAAVPARPPLTVNRPKGLVVRRYEPESGLIIKREATDRGREEFFRSGNMPKNRRIFREEAPIIE